MSRVAALALLAALAACRPDCTPARPGAAPIVLLVTVDTFRADHVGVYGSRRARTPNLDRLAAEGIRFEQAYSAANVTVPSHLSLLTSLPIATHRVLTNHAETAPAVTTLHDRFAAAGYRTAAFVSALHLGPTGPLRSVLHGLDRWDAPEKAVRPFVATETTDHLIAWLRGACRGPAFAWTHLWDPHMPYAPPAPFDREYYTGDPRDPRHTSMRDVQLDWVLHDLRPIRRRPGPHVLALRAVKDELHVSSRTARRLLLYPDQLAGYGADARDRLFPLIHTAQLNLHRTLPYNPPLAGFLTGIRDVDYPRALYAGEVSYVDEQLGRLRTTLEDWGIADRVVLVVTGDHGEGLGDHGLYFNHIGLWDEMLRVPLIVWAPGRVAPGVRREPVSGLDVAPSLLRLAGLDVPTAMEGRDVFAADARGPIVAEAAKGSQITLRDGDWKLVRTLESAWVNDAFHPARGDVELYDLAGDGAERVNRAAEAPEVTRALAARLDEWMRAHGIGVDGAGYRAQMPPHLGAAERERLRALGYVE